MSQTNIWVNLSNSVRNMVAFYPQIKNKINKIIDVKNSILHNAKSNLKTFTFAFWMGVITITAITVIK